MRAHAVEVKKKKAKEEKCHPALKGVERFQYARDSGTGEGSDGKHMLKSQAVFFLLGRFGWIGAFRSGEEILWKGPT